MVSKHVCGYEQKITRIYDYGYTYDKRGNLVKEEEICSPTTTGPRNITIATYLYDETNRMVQGTNKAGEVSAYTFNGLGVRVGTELILKDNTHGYTDFAMAHSRLVGFDLCPRLKELKQRHLYLPRDMAAPEDIAAVCRAQVDIQLIRTHWDSLVNLAASVKSGHVTAVAVLARFGSAARNDPIYEAGVQLGKLLRTVFLADYFVNSEFRQELRRVLNRGEAVNALKRAIYTGRIAAAQAKRSEEMQAVADALNLLANLVMAWNTMQMQQVLQGWANRRQHIAPELIGKIAPTRIEGINLRGVFRFPVERYADEIMPSLTQPVRKQHA